MTESPHFYFRPRGFKPGCSRPDHRHGYYPWCDECFVWMVAAYNSAEAVAERCRNSHEKLMNKAIKIVEVWIEASKSDNESRVDRLLEKFALFVGDEAGISSVIATSVVQAVSERAERRRKQRRRKK